MLQVLQKIAKYYQIRYPVLVTVGRVKLKNCIALLNVDANLNDKGGGGHTLIE